MLLSMLEEEFNFLMNKKVCLVFMYFLVLVVHNTLFYLALVRKNVFGSFNFCTAPLFCGDICNSNSV